MFSIVCTDNRREKTTNYFRLDAVELCEKTRLSLKSSVNNVSVEVHNNHLSERSRPIMISTFGLRMYVTPPISQTGNALAAGNARRRSFITCCFRFICRRSYKPSRGSTSASFSRGLAARGRRGGRRWSEGVTAAVTDCGGR